MKCESNSMRLMCSGSWCVSERGLSILSRQCTCPADFSPVSLLDLCQTGTSRPVARSIASSASETREGWVGDHPRRSNTCFSLINIFLQDSVYDKHLSEKHSLTRGKY